MNVSNGAAVLSNPCKKNAATGAQGTGYGDILCRMRLLPMLLLCAPMLCRAQATPGGPAAAQPVGVQAATGVPAQGTAAVTGEVTDTSGALVPGATVTLTWDATDPSAPARREITTKTDFDGDFAFHGLPAGSFSVKVMAAGMQSGSAKGSLSAGQLLEMPTIELHVASENTQVNVSFTQEELGVAEVQAEEKQRVMGILPNFGVAYDWNAPAMTTAQKYDVAWKEVIDPVSMGVVAGISGVQQATNSLRGYGQGWGGYGKRFSANLGNELFGEFLTTAVLPQVFHQDPRYFWKGSGTTSERVLYAMSAVVICRSDAADRHWEPNYSNILGSFGAGALSNAYYPASSRQGISLTFENGLLGLAEGAIGNVVQEFLLHRITPHLPPATPAPTMEP